MGRKIVIIGNGQIGKAISFLLEEAQKNSSKKNTIEIFDKEDSKNESKKTLKDCLPGADFLFLCIPSWHLSKLLQEISPILKSKTILISLAKGIDIDSKNTVNKIVEENSKNSYALMSGPMFAKEIVEGKMSYGILTTKKKEVFEKVSNLFKDTKIRLEYSKRVQAIAISGVLKNIYALAISILNNGTENNNLKGFLSAKGIEEMKEIMRILNLNKKIIYGTSGLGDLVATISSEYSQNRKVGEEISRDGKTTQKSEGLVSLSPLISILGKKSKKFPMLCFLEKVILENRNPKIETENFLKQI